MAKKTKPVKKRPKRVSNSARRFGIMNHVGGIWTPETFRTEGEAKGYLKSHSERFEGGLPKHKVVPVRVTVTLIR